MQSKELTDNELNVETMHFLLSYLAKVREVKIDKLVIKYNMFKLEL